MNFRCAYGFLVMFLCFCFLLPGCGSGNTPERATIQGQVTFDGEPVESGSIQFVPEPGVVGKPVATQISQGKYELPADKGPAVGKNKVIIQAMKKTGKQVKDIMGEMVEQQKEFIPSIYNEESELFVEIKPGSNTEDFSLKAP